jgi:hypothetical protein
VRTVKALLTLRWPANLLLDSFCAITVSVNPEEEAGICFWFRISLFYLFRTSTERHSYDIDIFMFLSQGNNIWTNWQIFIKLGTNIYQ